MFTFPDENCSAEEPIENFWVIMKPTDFWDNFSIPEEEDGVILG